MELILENIRCFAGRYRLSIKPVTFLTGENSSGKSTFLAALAAVNDFGFPLRPRLNEPPYNLGNYETIATYKGGRYGRAENFSLGYKEKTSNKRDTEIISTYIGKQGAVEIASLSSRNSVIDANLVFSMKNGKPTLSVVVTSGGTSKTYESELETASAKSSFTSLADTLFFSFLRNNRRISREAEKAAFDLATMFEGVGRGRATSVAPIRTKPRRTYDQVTEEFTPEGEHIPFVLSGILNDASARNILERFGVASGLFNHIGIKKLGNKISDPIQVLVTNSGRPANLLDVGYGVSQALPVVVESVLVAPEQLLLFQQPEVHLHPRSQAALGSLFVDLHQESNKQFVIETHSDYIIDRVRQEVARGRVAADDVQILYFEKRGSETNVFPIALDKRGNIVDPPLSYRDFFMEEEINLLSRSRD